MSDHTGDERSGPHFPPVHTGLTARSRLAELDGLDVDMIHDAVAVGDQARREVSAAYRSNYAGIRMQGETFGHLSELLSRRGWTKPRQKDDPLERIHAPSGAFALTVNSGTRDVGEIDGAPSTRRTRGGEGKKAVATNQGMLFSPMPWEDRTANALTWFLLFYVDEQDDGRVKLEVSLPEALTGGRITKWHERIIITPLDPPAGRIETEPTTPDVPEVDVPVLRRAR